jgi:glutamyl-tRNA reductase
MRRRERFHLSLEEAARLADGLAREEREAVVLATCNRTEVYLTGSDAADTGARAALALAQLGGLDVDANISVRSGETVARHLFSVAAGLESIVLGDIHVAAQVRQAHDAARTAGASGPLLNRLFEAASKAARRVHSETSVSSGATSVPAVAVASAARIAAPLADRRLLIVGAGRMARAAALNARMRGCRNITIANRTAVARELALRVGGRAVHLDCLRDELAVADVVICATASPGLVLTDEYLEAGRPIAIFDLALPRDVHPAFRDVTYLCDLDDLAATVSTTLARRRSQLALARAIAGEEASRYESWRRARAASPAIVAVRETAERTRHEVLVRGAGELTRLAASDRELVERITRQLVSKLSHELTLELRAQALADELTTSGGSSCTGCSLPGAAPGSSLANPGVEEITLPGDTSSSNDHPHQENDLGGNHAHQR